MRDEIPTKDEAKFHRRIEIDWQILIIRHPQINVTTCKCKITDKTRREQQQATKKNSRLKFSN